MDELDIHFLESLANRLSNALYYDTLKPIGVTRNSTGTGGLRHDDYDRLRKIVKKEKIKSLEEQLAKLRT